MREKHAAYLNLSPTTQVLPIITAFVSSHAPAAPLFWIYVPRQKQVVRSIQSGKVFQDGDRRDPEHERTGTGFRIVQNGTPVDARTGLSNSLFRCAANRTAAIPGPAGGL